MVTLSQGEADVAGTSLIDYYDTGAQLALDYRTDYATYLPADNPPIAFVIDQLSASATSSIGDIAYAQYELARDISYIYISTPKYFMGYVDDVHLLPKWYSILGEYQSRVHRTLQAGNVPTWFKFVSATRTDAVIDIVVAPPSGDFEIDTDFLPAQTNYGVEYTDDASPPAVTSVVKVGTDTIRITLASIPTGANKVIRIGGRCNFRDTTNEPSQTDASINLYNWLEIFQENVT
jgi:hypothetical protein